MSEQTVVTARIPFIRSAHTEVGDGTCGLCDVVWPCDAGTVLMALEARSAALARAEQALPDPAKLWSLAEWLEMKYPGDPNPEIQDDLRAWAKAIYATDPVKYGAYWVQSICDEEARSLAAATGQQPAATTQSAQEAAGHDA